MKKENRERIEGFLDEMEESLSGSRRQKEDIRTEIESDLLDRIAAEMDAGDSEKDAVDLALQEMGSPHEIAHGIDGVVAPASSSRIETLRRLVSVGVLLWAIYLCWNVRPWSYGAECAATLAAVLLFHVPVIIFAWPGIIWRKNWLFGLIPAGLAIGIAMGVGMMGVASNAEIVIPMTDDPGAIVEGSAPASDGSMPRWGQWLLFGGILCSFLVILGAMQQSQQRRWVFGLTSLFFLGVESAYQWEELRFRQDWKEIREFAEGYRDRRGGFPNKEALLSGGPPLHNDSFLFSDGTDGYSLFWNRPLSGGFALVADSRERSIRVQD